MKHIASFFLAAASAGGVQAHVHLEYEAAVAGRAYKATFQIGHGCEASPTRQVSVRVPAGFRGARPMPKAGWAVEQQREGDQVSRITWTAKTREDALHTSHYDEFVLVAQAPAHAGTAEWPVTQLCEEGRLDWKPKLTVIPAAAGGGHPH